MIAALLFLIAGMFNALMDCVKDKWYISIFNRGWLAKYQWWFDEDVAWFNKYQWKGNWLKYAFPLDSPRKELKRNKIPITFSSAWHLSKSLMLISIFLGVVFACSQENVLLIELLIGNLPDWLEFVILFVWYRGCFGLCFNLFYNHLLIKRK